MGWPIAAEMILIALLSNANQYIWNSFSADAVATIGSCNQVFSLAANAYGIISVGGSILLAPALGANRKREIPQLIITLIMLTIGAGIFFSVLGLFGIPLCIRVLHIPAELLRMTRQGMLTTLTAVFRSMGRMKLVMVNDVLVNLATLLFNAGVLYLIPRNQQTMLLYAMNSIYSQLIGCLVLLLILK